MADYLVDTNVLLRRIDPASSQRPAMRTALRLLHARGDRLYITPQIAAEFWCVCTRPTTARGGLGMAVAAADIRLTSLERVFTLLPDSPAIYREWRSLVVAARVSGVAVHDARLVAAMRTYGITHILTLDTADYARYPGITAVDPAAL